ncbi:1-acyl-sn-glycerol-3-phosphate acyltransferase [Klebsiella pneumoniae]|uniref:1-acyl-sn-glycerol-3-phosphate acyltransferase n=1 Tax=Klebsiella pneumoniae TaxID=573 RepID=A0A2X1S9Q8_KLEPN|nr:1-acyl-sn-glycerol-3-phosphate acyltransferase [Klebsiella pneumoniae]
MTVNNRTKAHGTIAEVVNAFKKRKISFWMFPEGTRSRGRGLLPFKTGAFHAAIAAGVPIIPVCVSNTSNKIKLNRWNNGLVIVEMLPPVDTTQFGKDNVRALATHCRELMAAKIADLDNEVAEREAAGKQIRQETPPTRAYCWRETNSLFICQYVMELICHSVGVSLLRLPA